jgi:hypothetical protein
MYWSAAQERKGVTLLKKYREPPIDFTPEGPSTVSTLDSAIDGHAHHQPSALSRANS